MGGRCESDLPCSDTDFSESMSGHSGDLNWSLEDDTDSPLLALPQISKKLKTSKKSKKIIKKSQNSFQVEKGKE